MIKLFRIFNAPKEIKLAEKRIAYLEHTTNSLLDQIDRLLELGESSYQSYDSIIKSLVDKYDGLSKWGNQLVQNIIDLRGIFAVGGGLRLKIKDGVDSQAVSKEIDFVKRFIEINDLDEEALINNAISAELEGRFLCRLDIDEDNKNVIINPVMYYDTPYNVIADSDNKQLAVRIEFRKNGEVIEQENFCYKKFGGRANDLNKTVPRLGLLLTQIESLDKALADLRKINSLFGCPTPHFKVETKQDAEELFEMLRKQRWTLGKMVVSVADFDIKSAAMQGAEIVLKEIEILARIISGTSGIPLHFIGYPDLLSNRATAENLTEMIYSATTKERRIWTGFYEELFDKAIEKANNEFKLGLKTGMIKCEFPMVTSSKLRELAEIWAVLYAAGIVDAEYVKSKIPE